MNCRQAQDEVLEMFDGAPSPEADAHVSACADCAAFLARQSALDRSLTGLLQPPELSPGFRSALRERIRREPERLRPEWLPDVVHLASCAVATVLCAVLLPLGAGTVLGVGGLVTAGTYLLVLMTRIWLDG
jgi:hypothetical protein